MWTRMNFFGLHSFACFCCFLGGRGGGDLTTWLDLHPPGTNVFIPIFFCGSVLICNILVQILKAVAVSIKILVNYGSISYISKLDIIA